VVGVIWAAARGSTPAPECTGARALDFGCFADRYEVLTRTAGPDAALNELDDQHTTNTYLLGACHQLTHVVGRTAGQLRRAAAFVDSSDVCASGYYHGLAEAIMMAIGPAQIVDQAQSVCAEQRQRDPYSFPHYNCVHGMGHGFMAVFKTDVFRSLAGCDALADPWEAHHCYGGVFMENLTAIDNPDRPSKDLRRDQPLYTCTEVNTRYKADCSMKQTAYALYVRNDDFGAVFALPRYDRTGVPVRLLPGHWW
jgi:hypothetical protein